MGFSEDINKQGSYRAFMQGLKTSKEAANKVASG